MQRSKPGSGVPLGQFDMTEEEERREARKGVITSAVTFAAIVFALRIGEKGIFELLLV